LELEPEPHASRGVADLVLHTLPWTKKRRVRGKQAWTPRTKKLWKMLAKHRALNPDESGALPTANALVAVGLEVDGASMVLLRGHLVEQKRGRTWVMSSELGHFLRCIDLDFRSLVCDVTPAHISRAGMRGVRASSIRIREACDALLDPLVNADCPLLDQKIVQIAIDQCEENYNRRKITKRGARAPTPVLNPVLDPVLDPGAAEEQPKYAKHAKHAKRAKDLPEQDADPPEQAEQEEEVPSEQAEEKDPSEQEEDPSEQEEDPSEQEEDQPEDKFELEQAEDQAKDQAEDVIEHAEDRSEQAEDVIEQAEDVIEQPEDQPEQAGDQPEHAEEHPGEQAKDQPERAEDQPEQDEEHTEKQAEDVIEQAEDQPEQAKAHAEGWTEEHSEYAEHRADAIAKAEERAKAGADEQAGPGSDAQNGTGDAQSETEQKAEAKEQAKLSGQDLVPQDKEHLVLVAHNQGAVQIQDDQPLATPF
jgi:hypothetical protein